MSKPVKVLDHLPAAQAQSVPAMPIEHILDRMVRDTSIDLDRLERMIGMQQDVERRRAEQAFAGAMSLVQSETRAVAADSNNPQTRSRYASYFALDKALRPIYTRHGFALSFNTDPDAPENCIRVVCYVSHDKGHTRKYQIDMPADGKGAKGGDVMTKTHATGSAATYGQRYLLKMIFNIAIGQDDDGNAAGNKPVTTEQADHIRRLILDADADAAKFCRYFQIAPTTDLTGLDEEDAREVWLTGVSLLPATKFTQAVAMLEAKRKPQ